MKDDDVSSPTLMKDDDVSSPTQRYPQSPTLPPYPQYCPTTTQRLSHPVLPPPHPAPIAPSAAPRAQVLGHRTERRRRPACDGVRCRHRELPLVSSERILPVHAAGHHRLPRRHWRPTPWCGASWSGKLATPNAGSRLNHRLSDLAACRQLQVNMHLQAAPPRACAVAAWP